MIRQRHNERSRSEIFMEVLGFIEKHPKTYITHIMLAINDSGSQTNALLDKAMRLELIERFPPNGHVKFKYEITEKGKTVLHYYRLYKSLIREPMAERFLA